MMETAPDSSSASPAVQAPTELAQSERRGGCCSDDRAVTQFWRQGRVAAGTGHVEQSPHGPDQVDMAWMAAGDRCPEYLGGPEVPDLVAVALVGATESEVRQTRAWLDQVATEGRDIELVEVACPGRIDRSGLSQFWTACGRPNILLQGDPAWAGRGARWLRDCGARVHVQGEGTQLSLL